MIIYNITDKHIGLTEADNDFFGYDRITKVLIAPCEGVCARSRPKLARKLIKMMARASKGETTNTLTEYIG